jgi:hypothetical protein
MLIARYLHRLPADYDVDAIRRRAAARGPQWDDVPGLYFKAFLLREKGRFGATAHSYSSLYLWEKSASLRDFLVNRAHSTGGFASVTDSFGRPLIQTWLPLDARRGKAAVARFVHTEELDVQLDADLTEVAARAVAQTQQVAALPGVVAAAVGLDTLNWRLIRFLVSNDETPPNADAVTFQVLHFARPLLDRLPI